MTTPTTPTPTTKFREYRHEEFKDDYTDPRWATFRNRVLRRDGVRCLCCNTDEGNLNAHHLYYVSYRHKWEYPISAAVTLCEKCHEENHRDPTVFLPWELLLGESTPQVLLGLQTRLQ